MSPADLFAALVSADRAADAAIIDLDRCQRNLARSRRYAHQLECTLALALIAIALMAYALLVRP